MRRSHVHYEDGSGILLRDCLCGDPAQSIADARADCERYYRSEDRAAGWMLLLFMVFTVAVSIAGVSGWIG